MSEVNDQLTLEDENDQSEAIEVDFMPIEHTLATDHNELADKNLNLIWTKVRNTDPAATKPVEQGRRKFTSIVPQHTIQKLTEMFGPAGMGWGWDILEDRFDKTVPILTADGDVFQDASGHVLYCQNHFVKMQLWYKLDSDGNACPLTPEGMAEVYKFHTPPQNGSTKYIYYSPGREPGSRGPSDPGAKGKMMVDEEAPKKSYTDAMKKCASLIGCHADVFLGEFDDKEMASARQSQANLARTVQREQTLEDAKQARVKWFKDHCQVLKTAANTHELETVYKICVATIEKQKRDKTLTQAERDGFAQSLNTFKAIHDKRLDELTGPNKSGEDNGNSKEDADRQAE